ncbi:alpha-mannosidase [Deinobacterium chartae]|uniref:Alpha-mannosidase n=1 Tax=Deinobacterium chartae TaxID=521158 RepID=A0A841I7W3_9DEIO|nr:glycoside hydrolase family 38 C-terminal domain-containing protein [Deinobacterium chartae]MBB6099895.1 alpha-mannosidase [Deinobacterium chartae]
MPAPDARLRWHLTPAQRLQLLERRLEELRAWRDRTRFSLRDWTFQVPGGALQPLTLGQPWPQVDPAVSAGPAVFRANVTLPETWLGQGAELELDLGGEGLVFLEGRALGGLNPFHRRFPLPDVVGRPLEVRVEAVPKGLFGAPSQDPRLRVACAALPEGAVVALLHDLEVLVASAAALEGHDAALQLIAAAEEALAQLDWPSASEAYRARLPDGLGGWDTADLWNLPASLPEARPLEEHQRASLQEARAGLHARLRRVRELFPPQGELWLSGHAHLDLAWLWPVAETRRKGRRTFETVLNLMDRYPDFSFNQSSAQLYAWMEQQHPELFGRIRQRVLEGRLEPVGGMWVEPDAQMTGGESLARQLLYGQRYFLSRFGRASRVAWLPDTFGFSGALPQLLREAGIEGFFTTKLTWNETRSFPHDLFWWEGIDGSRVLAHSFRNAVYSAPGLGSYNGDIAPAHLHAVWKAYAGRHHAAWQGARAVGLFTYGFGDGGGGPTAEMLERFERLRDYPASPRLRHARVDDFFECLPRQNLPVWVGELYLELHRGTLSSQGRIKALHRRAEHRLLEAEAALALAAWEGAVVQDADLEAAWKTLLLNQFHDILPGSSIREVYQQAEPELEAVVDRARRVRDTAMTAGAGPGGWTVFNPALEARELCALLPAADSAPLHGGVRLAAQAVEGGLWVSAPDLRVPPLGSLTLQADPAGERLRADRPQPLEAPSGAVLENDRLRVEVACDGTLRRIFDREAQREVLAGPGNRLVVFRDHPRNWEAWDVNPDAQLPEGGETLVACRLEVLERGPLRQAVRVSYRWRDSHVTQTYRLGARSRRLEVDTRLDWHERRCLLRAFFPLNVRSPRAAFETAFGVHERPTHRNAEADAARFEVSAHRFCDLSESGYGVSLLNDGRYGHSALGSTLGLTLLRSPVYPDPSADEGEHRFCYALYPHGGDWAAARSDREAFDLNSPLVVAPGQREWRAPLCLRGLPLALAALKPAEDGNGLILRAYEAYGARGQVTLEVAPGVQLTRVNLLEDPHPWHPAPGQTAQGRFDLEVGPFEVLTLRLEPSPD